MINHLFCLFIALFMALGACAPCLAQQIAPEEAQPSQSGALADGAYTPDAFEYSGGSGRVTLSCGQVFLSGGQATAAIRFSSPNYVYVKVDGVKYHGQNDSETSTFQIPVKLNAPNEITAMTTAMSQAREVEYTVTIRLSTPGAEQARAANQLPGLTWTSSMELKYATGFTVDYYQDGYALIDVKDDARYLVVPEGMPVPDGLDTSIVVIRQPLNDIYLAASSAMALFDAMDGLDAIRFSGTRQSGWYIQNAAGAMARGDILYAGGYSEPDYELLVKENCDLAVESTMILHSPKTKEMIELLGIPVLVDRSSYESHPLGRTEWIRLYSVLLDREEQADAFFETQAAIIERLSDFENTGKTVAYFYVSTDGSVVVRGSSDYIPGMIELAGGKYVFEDLSDPESGRSSVSLTMEEFYAAAVDADYIIYNATVDSPLKSIDGLLAKSGLFADFKAVKDGNVWCTDKYLYQATDIVGSLITDINRMLTGQTDGMTFIYRLD